MLHPTTLSWRTSQPTGMGFNASEYLRSQRIRRPRFSLSSLGDASLNQELAISGTASATAGSMLTMLAPKDSSGNPTGPLAMAGEVGAIIQGVLTIAIGIASLFKGCGATCTQATQIANQVGTLLQQNVDHYLAQPIHYQSVQQAALLVFDQTWQALLQACGQPQLQAAGQRCISDRQQGACVWKASPGGWTQDSTGKWSYHGAGASGSGDACWNWFVGYRSPIANDPTVVPDPAGLVVNADGSITISNPNSSPAPTTTVATPLAGLPMPLVLGGAAVLLLMFIGGGGK
jgi:hypothetical protein